MEEEMRAFVSWVLVATSAVALVACGGEQPTGETAAAAEGAQVWAANCAACHGPQGEGTTAGPPLVHIIYEPGHHPDESFRRAVQQGVVAHHWDFGDMPPQPEVSEEEIEAAIAHVRVLQREAGIIP
jgi:mono/diheme cytochrome c family protein